MRSDPLQTLSYYLHVYHIHFYVRPFWKMKQNSMINLFEMQSNFFFRCLCRSAATRRTSASCRRSSAQEVMTWIRLRRVCSAWKGKKVTCVKLSRARPSVKVTGSTDGLVINTLRSTIAEELFWPLWTLTSCLRPHGLDTGDGLVSWSKRVALKRPYYFHVQ